MFTEYPPVIDRSKLIHALNRIADSKTPPASEEKPAEEKQPILAAATSSQGLPAETEVKNDRHSEYASEKAAVISSLTEKKPVETIGSPSAIAPKNNMVFEETPAGLRLSVRDIKFKADSDEILPSEKSRLDEIAEVLKLAPNSQFLIEGHSAAVGNPGGEQKISELRAKKIAQELSARGIAAGKFICKGHGGNKPIAGNETAEGRAQNRRVEITILE